MTDISKKVTILLKRGVKNDLPTLREGELGLATDTKELFIGSANGNVKLAGQSSVDSLLQSLQATNAEVTKVNKRTSAVARFDSINYKDGNFPDIGTLESGHPYKVTYNTEGFKVVNGGLQSSSSLAYLNVDDFSSDITEISVDVSWSNDGGTEDRAAVLIVSDGPFANNYPNSYANTGCHLLLYPNRWILQKRPANGPVVNVASFSYIEPYSKPVPYGERVNYKVKRVGNKLYVTRHDGGVTVAQMDSEQIDWMGEHACIEIVGKSTGNNVTIHSFAISSQIQSASITDKEGGQSANKARGTSIKAPAAQNIVLQPTYTTVLSKKVIVPGSLAVSVIVSLPVNVLANGNLQAQVSFDGNPTSATDGTLLVGQAYNGVVTWTATLDLSEFKVGSSSNLLVKLAHGGTGSFVTSPSNPKLVPSVTVIPVLGEFS